MLAAVRETLDDHVVRALAEKPGQTATGLFGHVEKDLKKKPTPQGWYKALRRLLAEEVLIKDGKKYSLNARWVLGIVKYAQKAEKTHLGETDVKLVRLPQPGKRITFHFKNLLAMDAFWGHVLVYIASRTKKPSVLYAYNPHFWFYLAHEQSERQYNQGMRRYGVKTHMIIGSDSFLDRWSTQFFDKQFFKYWLHPVSMYATDTNSYNYLGGYFIEVKISPKTAREVDGLFKNIKDLGQISPLNLISIFQTESACSLNISRSKTKGEALKRRVERYIKKAKSKT